VVGSSDGDLMSVSESQSVSAIVVHLINIIHSVDFGQYVALLGYSYLVELY
jgi:hypothetical protein